MPSRGRCRATAAAAALVALLAALPSTVAQCNPVIAEFVLTGLGNKDGNRANHEVGICLPQFIVNVTSSCTLTVRPKYAVSSLGDALKLGLPILSGILVFFIAEKIVSNFTGNGGGHGHSHGGESGERKNESRGQQQRATSPARTRGRADASPTRNSGGGSKSPSAASAAAGGGKGAKKSSSAPRSSFAAIKAAGWLNLVADMMHNFTDGLAIGVAFRSGIGASTTVAVFFHEVPHNVADFGILMQNGFSKRAALIAQFISATGSLLGCILGLTLEKVIGLDLFVAGGFIYIATVDVIPDLLKDSNIWHTLQEAVAICFGVAMMALMLLAE